MFDKLMDVLEALAILVIVYGMIVVGALLTQDVADTTSSTASTCHYIIGPVGPVCEEVAE
jgi:hypothetical protein